MASTFRKLKILLYKNFLVRKRQWKSALIIQILLPLIIVYLFSNEFYKVVSINIYLNDLQKQYISSPEEVNYSFDDLLLVKPPNADGQTSIIEHATKCILGKSIDNDSKFQQYTIFKSESDMIDRFKRNDKTFQTAAIVINELTESKLNYKIFIKNKYHDYDDSIPKLQLCLDIAFLESKSNKTVQISTQDMNYGVNYLKIPYTTVIYGFLMCVAITLSLQLCLETSKVVEEKFLGVNVLMAMNGVPNYLNLLSWHLSGLIFSLLYIVPIILLFSFGFRVTVPFLYGGNSFIFFLILILHSVHLFSFGMHISAYFTRGKFLSIGLLLIYAIPIAISIFSLKSNSLVPYLGIVFPSILLTRACEIIAYYQIMTGSGIHWENFFEVDESAFGIAGSLGMIIIFSILGAVLHFILAIYIYAVKPGKYGAKKHPLYFLKFFKTSKNNNDHEKIENHLPNCKFNKPFERVPEGAFTAGIQLKNLQKTFNVGLFGQSRVHALKGISMDFYQGQITSLLGHNGAGKTTMMSILTGMNHATKGTVIINGKNAENHLDEIMTDMGLCPQENIVFPNLSIYQQFKLFAMLKNKNNPNSVVQKKIEECLKMLKLYEKRNTEPKKLSGGQKRRVCLGMTLVGDSSILILDEPTSGLDPETKRSIWDILLKMKGEKTVIISTHDMEEADILGDRIAIVHSGTLKSYGTPMFLKKHLGRGNVEVTLSTEPWCKPENIRAYFGSQSELLSADGRKIIMNIPYTPELPDALDRTESHKKNLGITGMSVSLITLEQVFLKVTKEDKDAFDEREPLACASPKLEGWQRSFQAAKGLLYKKTTYTGKNMMTSIYRIVLVLIALLALGMMLKNKSSTDTFTGGFNLDNNCENVKVFFTSEGDLKDNFGNGYREIVNHYRGMVQESHGNLIDELLKIRNQNYKEYDTCVPAGAEFYANSSFIITATAMYNKEASTYAKPMSLNLLTNGILKALSSKKDQEYEIKMSIQQLPDEEHTKTFNEVIIDMILKYAAPLIFAIVVILMAAPSVIHPLQENVTNIKHLQKMTGLSAFNYWGTMLLFDLILMTILSVIVIIGFVIIDQVYNLDLLGVKETFIFFVLLFLFSLSVLPCIYCTTFIFRTTNAAMNFLTLLPIGLVILEMIMALMMITIKSSTLDVIRPIQKSVVLLTPIVGFYHGASAFFKKIVENHRCRQNYQSSRLFDESCANSNKFFNNFEGDISLEGGLLSLGVTFVLYSIILWVLENKLIPMLIVKACGDKLPPSDDNDDEQVKKVKRDLVDEIDSIKTKSSKIIANSRTIDNVENGVLDKSVFLVHGLRKKYGSLVAVQDINFNVKQGECFGLLGVNGAGKSTAFRIMNGQEVPHNGVMFLSGKDLTKTSSRSEMGYCPQNDALVTSLNAYDHLRLFARLRGIPEHEVHKEVNKWIKRLNLTVPGRNPSDTYSGGNKRRLNIAISMIGLPNLVLLDEPTTGVDPAARRSLWNVIKSAQKTTGQAVIFTSHSMEECEALCHRLGIMVNGKFVCIGATEELKQRFGAGYDIQMKLNPEKSISEIKGIKRDIEASLQCELVDENLGYLMYHILSTETKWRKMYDVMNQIKHKYSSIDDFTVLSSTLEQLFLLFARAANKSY